MGIDPVCGMTIDAKLQNSGANTGERPAIFCAPGCKKRIDSNPERYARQD